MKILVNANQLAKFGVPMTLGLGVRQGEHFCPHTYVNKTRWSNSRFEIS